jgi:bla regulator protein BlaR1
MNLLISVFKEVIYLGATASILILIILFTKKVFYRTLSPKWHYYIWVLLIIRLLIPFSPESSISVYSLLNTAADKINLPVREISIQNPINVVETLPVAVEDRSDEKSGHSGDSSYADDTVSAIKESPKLNSQLMTAALIWIVGVLLISMYTIYINIAFAVNVRKRYTLLKDSRIQGILKECKSIMKVKHRILLLTSEKVRTPALYGFVNTKILVSKEYMEKLNDDEIKYIFLHELSHYKRKDIIVNWVLALLRSVYFFNPLIWYAFNKIHEDCEVSCDAEALRYINEEEHHSYGSTIIKLIKLYSESNFIPTTSGISKNKSSYKRRIVMISRFRKGKWTNTLLALVLITSVGLTGLTGCKISESKEKDVKVASSGSASDSENKGSQSPIVQQEVKSPNNSGSDKQGQTNTNPEVKPQNNVATDKPAQSTTTKTNEGKEIFYGDWVIKKVAAYGSVGTYSKESAESLIGKGLSFSKDKATSFGDQPSDITKVASNPVYKKTTISKADFVTNYRMTLDKLGINADSVTGVTVSDSKGTVTTFLVKDENTLIIIGGGTYFELVRKPA